jgi:hypothetical protein
MELIDTNILYYKFENPKYKIDVQGKNISSINALEFLRNIEKVHPNSAPYFIPLYKNINHHFSALLAKSHGDKPFNKIHSDYVTFEFNNEFPSYNLYNNLSVQFAVNYRQNELLKASIKFLPKVNYKEIYSKFGFLTGSELNCISLEERDLDLSLELLSKFLLNHSLKEDFRNCWNDLLIASTAVNRNLKLVSKDKLLNQFISSELGVKPRKITDAITEFDFSSNEVSDRKHEKFESKGYINRSWNYHLKRK